MRKAGKKFETAFTSRLLPGPNWKQILKHNILSCLRNHRIPEDLEKKNQENRTPTNIKVKDMFNKNGVDNKVKKVRTLGKFNKDRKNSKTILVTFKMEHEAR